MKKVTNSTEETIKLAKKTAENLKKGDILLLKGGLGSGKTTFVKGICGYFNISKDEVRSPTFTLLNEYQTQKHTDQAEKIIHIDTYRMKDEKGLIDIGFEEYLENTNSIILIEWPEKVKNLLKNKKTKIAKFKHKNEDQREINIEPQKQSD